MLLASAIQPLPSLFAFLFYFSLWQGTCHRFSNLFKNARLPAGLPVHMPTCLPACLLPTTVIKTALNRSCLGYFNLFTLLYNPGWDFYVSSDLNKFLATFTSPLSEMWRRAKKWLLKFWHFSRIFNFVQTCVQGVWKRECKGEREIQSP